MEFSKAKTETADDQETQDMLDFCAKHGITCPHELIPADPAKVNEAYERAVKLGGGGKWGLGGWVIGLESNIFV